MTLPIEELGRLIARKRGARGIRAAAAEAEVSPATLSRVENGNLPDLATFAKICRWLNVDPARFLGVQHDMPSAMPERAVAHFRKKATVSKETAQSLGALILAAQRARQARADLERGD
jgi:transcriptional regulator with XRE-family HTH domain